MKKKKYIIECKVVTTSNGRVIKNEYVYYDLDYLKGLLDHCGYEMNGKGNHMFNDYGAVRFDIYMLDYRKGVLV